MKKTKKFFRICFAAVLLIAMLLPYFPAAAAYDAQAEGIVSAYYPIDRNQGFLMGVTPGTAAEDLLRMCLPGDCALSQAVPATGATVTSGDHSLTVIVTADLNGDAAVTITDLLLLKNALLGNPLEPAAAAAADVNYDGSVTITDFLQIKSALLGISPITYGWHAGIPVTDTLQLMSLGSIGAWQGPEGTASYTYDNGDIAPINGSGVISACAAGSSFVYALDADGAVLARTMVSIVPQPLVMWLNVPSLQLAPGQAGSLSAHWNHPRPPVVAWSSSNEAIATVSQDGTVTAVSYGSAVITAMHTDGTYAQATVNVASPITGLSLDKLLYKVKPGHSRTPILSVYPAGSGEEFIWASSDPNIVQVAPDGTFTGINYGTATVTVTGKYSGISTSCTVKVCDVKQVAITYDDGPSKNTTIILDFLKQHGIPATFFLVGKQIPYYTDVVIREAAEGHELGYHSYAHEIQRGLTSEQIRSDFDQTNELVQSLTGRGITVWRAPGGDFDQRVLDAIPLPHIYWTVDTRDWEVLNADIVANNILSNATDGSIILLHDLYYSSAMGSMRAMEVMLEGDYEFLTVTQLLSRNGTPPANSTNYRNG